MLILKSHSPMFKNLMNYLKKRTASHPDLFSNTITQQTLDSDFDHSGLILCVTLDAVRTFLARWLSPTHESILNEVWKPLILSRSFEFIESNYVSSFNFSQCTKADEKFIKIRIIWEYQLALHSRLWPIFDVRINQFEHEQWVKDSGITISKQEDDDQLRQQLHVALTTVASWSTPS